MSLILFPVIIVVVIVVAAIAAVVCILDKGVSRHEGSKGS